MTAPARVTLADILVYLAPVYLGPFLAGLAKTAWTVPALIAASGLGLAVWIQPLRPFPGAAFAFRLFALLFHTGLVAGAFMLGLALARGGFTLPLPVWLPIGTSLAVGAFALWRLSALQRPLDPTNSEVPVPDVPDAPDSPPRAPELEPEPATVPDTLARLASPGVQDALTSIWSAPPTPETVDPILQQITQADRPAATFSALLAAMDEGSDAADFCAMRFLRAAPARTAALKDGRLSMALSLGFSSFSDPVRAEACEIAYTLIADGAGPRAFPARDRLHNIGKTFPDTAETMAALAAHLGAGGRS